MKGSGHIIIYARACGHVGGAYTMGYILRNARFSISQWFVEKQGRTVLK